MVQILLRYKWKYVSLVYSEGAYGNNLRKQILKEAKKNDICIGYIGMLESEATQEDISVVVKKLRQTKARVVVILLEAFHCELFYINTNLLESNTGEFIFVASDSMAERDFGNRFDGGLVTYFPLRHLPEFIKHIHQMTPKNANNPYFLDIWKNHYNCEYKNESISANKTFFVADCADLEDIPIPSDPVNSWSATVSDGFYTVAHALDQLIRDKCPEVFLNTTDIKHCVTGTDLLKYMKKTTFTGNSWNVKFDSNGDLEGLTSFNQFYQARFKQQEIILIWDNSNKEVSVHTGKEDWSVFWNHNNSFGQTRSSADPPDSVCSRPCPARHYAQQKEIECCWECIKCRNNEHLNHERTACVICPELTWPHSSIDTKCTLIEPE